MSIAAGLFFGAAHAHVAPSTNDNQRYVKVTVAPDVVRLAYTVVFGDEPAAAQRRAMDSDNDGEASEAEQAALARALAQEVAQRLTLVVDGREVPVEFALRSVGNAGAGTRGAFSVDLIATPCVPPRRTHELSLRDEFHLPRLGETQLSIGDVVSGTVTRASVGAVRATDGHFHFAGAAAPLSTHGLTLAVRFADEPGPSSCPPPAAATAPAQAWRAALGACALAVAIAAGLWARRRRAG